MKKNINFVLLVISFILGISSIFGQEPERFVIEMSLQYKGETIAIADVSTVSYSIQRYQESLTENAETSPYVSPTFYISISLKQLNKKIATLMASRDIKFDGKILFKDSYGKEPVRELKFMNGMFNTASENFAAGAAYSDYGYASVTVECQALSLDGVDIQK